METAILDVGLGLTMVFFLMAMLASGLAEWVTLVLRTRSKRLKSAVEDMFVDEGHRERFWEHPLIEALGGGKKKSGPSSIPNDTFARAFLETVDDVGHKIPPTVDKLREYIEKLPKKFKGRDALLAFMDGSGSKLEDLRRDIEEWFDLTMDKVSAWYKGHMKLVLFLMSLLLAVLLNVDSIDLARTIWNQPVTGTALAAQVTELVKEDRPKGTPEEELSFADSGQRIESAKGRLAEVTQGILGMKSSLEIFDLDWKLALLKILGWLITAAAASFGAPFWYDVMKKVASVKGKRTRTPEPQAQPASEPAKQ